MPRRARRHPADRGTSRRRPHAARRRRAVRASTRSRRGRRCGVRDVVSTCRSAAVARARATSSPTAAPTRSTLSSTRRYGCAASASATGAIASGPGAGLEVEGAGDAGHDVAGFGVLEFDDDRDPRAATRVLEREPGLADAAGTDDGHPPAILERGAEGGEVVVASDEGVVREPHGCRVLAPLGRRGHEFCAAVGAELALQARDVALDRAHGDEQLRGDLGVAQAPLDGGEDRALAGGQRRARHGAQSRTRVPAPHRLGRSGTPRSRARRDCARRSWS